MSKKNEDSVERFFRKAVSHYDKSFVAQDWGKMEKLLDNEAARRTAIRSRNLKRGAISGAVVAIVMVVVYFLAVDQTHPESQLIPGNSTKKMQAAAGAEAPNTSSPEQVNPSAALLLPEPGSGGAEKNKGQPVPSGSHNPAGGTIPVVTSKTSAVARHEGDAEMGSVTLTAASPLKVSENRNVDETKLPSQTQSALHKEEAYVERDNISGAPKKEKTVVTDVEGEKNASVKGVTDTEDVNNIKDEVAEEENEKKHLVPSRWSFTAAVAPDFSGTQVTRYGSPGKAYGLLIGYNLTKRLAISAGVLKSSKQYEGQGSDYQPPDGYWQRRTNGIIPAEVYGQCSVLETPILVQYSFVQRTKSRAYVATGLSNYLMLSESYEYIFATENPGAAAGWQSRESSSHTLGIGHLSVGYERYITPRFAVGVEPFLKVPLVGIGWSRLDLFTTGAYLNVRYRILTREKISGITN